LTLVGCGPAGRAWRKSAGVLGIEKQLRWVDWLPVAEVEELYGSHDALLFPSLHDSGGMVVLEAMARGLPVVCLALGGPGLIVDNTCGLKIDVEGRSRSDVEMALIQALEQLARDPHLIARLRTGAKQKARLMSWNNLIAGTYGHNLLINPKTTTF
jgi:glycosyltransferase involved in cell wall biosynthesis